MITPDNNPAKLVFTGDPHDTKKKLGGKDLTSVGRDVRFEIGSHGPVTRA